MKEVVDIFAVLKRNTPLFIGLCLCAYFSYHTMFGKYGYTQILNLSPMATAREVQLKVLVDKSSSLEVKVSLLRPDTLSADILDEQVRLILGYSYEGEVVILSK